jgi:uncharacterized membrane protein YdjX (TVP38/TMEM64 family)
MSHHAATLRWIAWAVIIASLLVIIRVVPLSDGVAAVRSWVAGLGVWGPLAFGLIYILAVVTMLPASLLTLAAGATFGLVVGTLTVTLAANIGSALALLIARHLARGRIESLLHNRPRLAAVDRALRDGGWKLVALLRLSPAVPYNVLNYLLGLTSIGFWTCVVTSLVTMLPGTFLYVYLGYLAGSVTGPRGAKTPAEWTMLAVGLLATLALTVYLAHLARRKLRQQTGITAGKTDDDQPPQADTSFLPDLREQPQSAPQPGSTLAILGVALLLATLATLTLIRPGLITDALRSILPFDAPADSMT